MLFRIKIDAKLKAVDLDDAIQRLALHFTRVALDVDYCETVFEPNSDVQIYGEMPTVGRSSG